MTSLEYTQGFHDGLIEASWQCLDCGNTYQAGVEHCPNDLIDQAAAQLKAARWRLENAPAPQTTESEIEEEPARVQHHDEETIRRWAEVLEDAFNWGKSVVVVMTDRTVEGEVDKPHFRAENLYTVAGVTINARFPSERIVDIEAARYPKPPEQPEEPPIGSVVKCEDCFVTFFRWTDGWFADDGVSITWDRIIGSGDPITVVYRAEP